MISQKMCYYKVYQNFRQKLPEKYPSCKLVFFIDVSTYIYTYRRKKFQSIFEKKLRSCFLTVTTYLLNNMELNMRSIVLMEFVYIGLF